MSITTDEALTRGIAIVDTFIETCKTARTKLDTDLEAFGTELDKSGMPEQMTEVIINACMLHMIKRGKELE